jgi:hypothetical protein
MIMSKKKLTPSAEQLKALPPPDYSPPIERILFAKNFRNARRAKKFTQAYVVKATGFNQSYLSLVENGRATISLDNAALLAKTIGTDLWKLLIP